VFPNECAMKYLFLMMSSVILFGAEVLALCGKESSTSFLEESEEFKDPDLYDFMFATPQQKRNMYETQVPLILSKASEPCEGLEEQKTLFCVLRKEIYRLRSFLRYRYNIKDDSKKYYRVQRYLNSWVWKEKEGDFTPVGNVRDNLDNTQKDFFCVLMLWGDKRSERCSLLGIAVMPYDYFLETTQKCCEIFAKFQHAIEDLKEPEESIDTMKGCLSVGMMCPYLKKDKESAVKEWIGRTVKHNCAVYECIQNTHLTGGGVYDCTEKSVLSEWKGCVIRLQRTWNPLELHFWHTDECQEPKKDL